MFLLNLSLGEFLALFAATSAIVVALYLLDRSRRRLTVPTLRFWKASDRPVEFQRRRWFRQPLSLLLQLLGLTLLLLAIAQLRLGSVDRSSRDHILILDTSAWMGAAGGGRGTLMAEARAAARAFVRALPPSDRVMVVRADALATPATGFETSRRALEDAIQASVPGSTALNLGQALAFARQTRTLHARRPGEIVFAGAARVHEYDSAGLQAPPEGLRMLMPPPKPVEDCGLRRIAVRRSSADPEVWEVFVSARNYGSLRREAPLAVQFGGAPVGSRRLSLPPGTEQEATFQFRTRAAGWLEARILLDDALPDNNRAILELPQQKVLTVFVYTDEPESLRPALAANPLVRAVFRRPGEFREEPEAGIVILDRFRPVSLPSADAIWIQPPPGGSPIPVRSTLAKARVSRWLAGHVLTTGLRARDLETGPVQIYGPAADDFRVAEAEAGPVIVARSGKFKTLVLGFHPGLGALRYELTTPLLFANVLHWMNPAAFRRWELSAGSAGAVSVPLDPDVDPASVRVLADGQAELPFTVQDGTLRLFAGTSGTVRVLAGDREMVYSLTLPDVAEVNWEPPAAVARGVPRAARAEASSRDIWQWLALAGILVLFAEWLLYGRARQVLHGAPRRRNWLSVSWWRSLLRGFRPAARRVA